MSGEIRVSDDGSNSNNGPLNSTLRRTKSFESDDGMSTYLVAPPNITCRISLYKKFRNSIENIAKGSSNLKTEGNVKGVFLVIFSVVILFEEETNRNFWGIRYSRRMAIMSNLLLGLWTFWSRFLKEIQKQKKSSLLGVVVTSPLKQHSINKILYEGSVKAISKSWVFFVSAALLSRNQSWKRHLAVFIALCYSLQAVMFKNDSAGSGKMTNYFNMFANLLYITATFSGPANETSTLNDFIGLESEQLS